MSQPTSSSSSATPKTSLALSELHIRLEALEKEHQSLLKRIKNKRTELKRFVDQMRSIATELAQKVTPIFQKMIGIDQEIHTLFTEVLTNNNFGKKTKKKIKAIYHNLQFSGIISPKLDNSESDIEDELFETPEQENDFSQKSQSRRYQDWKTQQELESASGSRSDSDRKIRQTFLKLAEIFHPDKVTDSETQMRHTEIMKEINKAYQESDLARLLEIEQQYELGEIIDNNNEDDLLGRCNRLFQQNEILKTQYKNLKRELSMVKKTHEGAIVSDYRKAVKQKNDPIAQMVSEIESQLQTLVDVRDFVKGFVENKITIKEFLCGPEIMRSFNQEMMEDMIEQMF